MLQTRWRLKPEFVVSASDGGPIAQEQARETASLLTTALRARLAAELDNGTALGLILVQLPSLHLFDMLYGRALGETALHQLKGILREETRDIFAPAGHHFLEKIDDATVVFISPYREPGLEGLAELAFRLRLAARNHLNHQVVQLTGQDLSVEVGYALLPASSGKNLEDLLYAALDDARQTAGGRLDMEKLGLMQQFREVVEAPLLTSVYQPIVDLRLGEVLGWEALARGPRDHYFRSPQMLFDFAEEVGWVFRLERVCREQAFAGLGALAHRQKLFVNIHPQTLGDPNFRPGETRQILERYGLRPHNVVFEITERHPIKDFTLFHRTLDHYRSQGYLVAIDDVGTGYSGLHSLAKVRPDFIKVDMGLIRGIDANPVQRALLETLVTFADKIGCSIVAEGIETETELTSIVDMGVHFGQGYFLARPSRPKPHPSLAASFWGAHKRRTLSEWTCAMPVRDLVEPAIRVTPEARTREVKKVLDSQPISGVVVVEGVKPLGLVMSHSLDRLLGAYYGTALYWDRSVTRVMDPAPLVVEGPTPVEQVAKTAMRRERFKIYDHIIVTEGGALRGIVSVQKMLDALARVQVEMARGMSPLTGLPGNVALEQEAERRCGDGLPVSFVYADLDHFKVYNDNYGFEAGDKMILLLSRVLAWAMRRHGGEEGFLGHLGGDDFVLMTSPERAERLCQAVVRCFKRLVGNCYGPEDRENGFVLGKDRMGRPGRFPLVSVSLAIVDCQGVCQIGSVSQRAAEVKRYAKSLPGNVYVRDRRAPLGLQPPQATPSEGSEPPAPAC